MKSSVALLAAVVVVAAVVVFVVLSSDKHKDRTVVVNEWWPRRWPGHGPRHNGVWLGPGGTQRLLGSAHRG